MAIMSQDLLNKYTEKLQNIYGNYLCSIISYASYARGDYTDTSDTDIMILLSLSDFDIKKYRHQLSNMTYDFNMEYDVDIKPIAKNQTHFLKWIKNYPFYANINREGLYLYEAV